MENEMEKANPRGYPDRLVSAESGRVMVRGFKLVWVTVDGRSYEYLQPGWWCDLDNPDDLEGQMVDEDNVARAEFVARVRLGR